MIRHINTPTQFLKAAIYAAESHRGIGGRSARFHVRQAIEGARSGSMSYADSIEQVGSSLLTTDPAHRTRLSGRLRAGIRKLLQ